MQFIEGSKFKALNFPDPHDFGDLYKPIFPPYHRTVKAIMDNIPETVEKIYIFGSSIRIDCSPYTDVDVFIVGEMTDSEYKKMIKALPVNKGADILIEKAEEFYFNVEDESNSMYRRIFEGGYKIYERKKN